MLVYNVHPSWEDFLTTDILNKLSIIENKIGDNFTPSKELILRFLSTDCNNIKVVIMGQDPYFQEGVANGRSFQPGNLKSFTDSFKQVSLKNILRLIYKSINGELLPYKDVASKMALSPGEWFDFLERQGVLFLNTYFTCEIGKPNSHRNIWGDFINDVIKYINSHSNPVWFLWGNEAKALEELIEGKCYISNHPMMSNTKSEKDFFKSKCFIETKDIINWLE